MGATGKLTFGWIGDFAGLINVDAGAIEFEVEDNALDFTVQDDAITFEVTC